LCLEWRADGLRRPGVEREAAVHRALREIGLNTVLLDPVPSNHLE